MMDSHDIAIVGMACQYPKAPTVARYWHNLANGVDGISDVPRRRFREHSNFALPPDHDAYIPIRRGGFLEDEVMFNPVPYGIPPNLVKHGDPDQFFILDIVDRALRDARVAPDAPVRKRTDVIIGRGASPSGKLVELTLRAELFETVLELIDRQYPEMVGNRRHEIEDFLRSTLTPKSVDNVSTAVSNITASRTANRLNLRGAAYTIDAACASSLLAVEQAVWRLRTRQCDLAVASGIFLSMTAAFLYVFARLGAISPSQISRPLDRRSDGLLVGEGGGAVILKRLEDAIRDGDQIYAVVKGVGSASDGHEVDVLAPASPGQVLCLENAYRDAGIDRDTISLLELHGTGTVVGDQVEIQTIKTFYGTSAHPPTARAMGSVKSMIGHTMPAAGMASLIKTALALSNKIIPPSLNCEQPREDLIDAPFYVATQTRPWVHNVSHSPRRAGANAFGFGGINAHVILEEVAREPGVKSSSVAIPRPILPGVKRPSELLAFSAATRPELLARVERVEKFLAHDWHQATLGDVAAALAREIDHSQPFKLGLVAEDLTQLQKQFAVCRERLAGDAPHFNDWEEIYYSETAARHEGKIACIFPGMGFPGLIGNYPDHLLELCTHYPEVREEFDFFEERDRHPEDTVPTSSIFSPPPSLPEEYRTKLKKRLAPPKVEEFSGQEPPAEERYLAAMGVTLSNWVGWVLLRKFGIPVDMVTGQSQGEMAALCVVGVCDFHETAPHFWKVLNVDTRDISGQRLAFAWAPPERVQPLLDQNPGTYIAIHMAPEAIIFGGDREGLLRVGEELRKEQVLVSLLPYPPIHTPALSHLRDDLLDNLNPEEFELKKPQVALYSSITADRYPDDPTGIRETLMLNVDNPLRIWQTIRRLYDDGARIFVQVGGGHMAAHMERLLPPGAKIVTAALDVDTRNPITQLNHLCATLFTAGVPIQLGPLFEFRALQEVDLGATGPPPQPRKMEIPLRIDWSPLYHETVRPRRTPIRSSGAAVVEQQLAAADLQPAAAGAAAASAAAEALAVELPLSAIAAEPAEQQPAIAPEIVAAESPAYDFDPRLPVLGTVERFVPEQEIFIRRQLTVADDLFLHDHLFVFADKPVAEKLPVQPLTFSMEFVAEAAALLSPDRGLIGFENVRGLRWVGLRDKEQDEYLVEARVVGDDLETGVRRVDCVLYFEGKPGFSATVLMGQAYRQDLQFEVADSSGDGPWPFTADRIYPERFMFHGPAFHVFESLDTLGNPGATATLHAMPRDRLFASNPDPILLTDPCLMDGIGQIVGLWALANDIYILPTGCEKIELYGPPPAPGALVTMRMETLEINEQTKQMRFNVEIIDEHGYVYARVYNWSEWVWRWSKKYAEATRLPSHYLMGDRLDVPGLPPGAALMAVHKQDFKDIDPDWAARVFLHTNEMAEYWALESQRAKRQRVLSRAALKDAIRLWWSERYGTLYPHFADLCVVADDQGAPWLAPIGDPALPRISVAHTADLAVGIAADVPVGVDIEPLSAKTDEIMPYIATDGEQTLVDSLTETSGDASWRVRLWCAKEAVAKLLGTGLQGRPKDFVAIDADPQGDVVVEYVPTGDRYAVFTFVWSDHVIAHVSLPVQAAGEASLPDLQLADPVA